jgi:hypothetical protein
MRHVKLFEDFSSQESLSEEQIEWLDRCTGRGSWSVNPTTGLIDVDGDFSCAQEYSRDFKDVKFGHINKSFDCSGNELKDLKGAPQTVGENFYCDNNELTSLEGAPLTVGGSFHCTGNNLTDLKEAPLTVEGHFYCNNNYLTSLEGAPQKVGGDFGIRAWDDPMDMKILGWHNGWEKKGDADFLRKLFAKLKEIENLPESRPNPVNKSLLISMLLSLAGFDSVSDFLLSGKIPVGDKFEIYRAVKGIMPEVWDKVKDQLDPDGDTSELMDIGF